MADTSIFGRRHVGTIVQLKLLGGHEGSFEIVDVEAIGKVEVRELGGTGTWHIPSKSIVAWQFLAHPGDTTEAA